MSDESQQGPQPPTAAPRTKLVFVYSDDEEGTADASGGARVVAADGIAADEATLAALQSEAEAQAAAEAQQHSSAADALLPPMFVEDLTGAPADAAVPIAGSGGMRVRVVQADALLDPVSEAAARRQRWEQRAGAEEDEGGADSGDGNGSGARAPRRLKPEDLAAHARLGGRKRFRDDAADGSAGEDDTGDLIEEAVVDALDAVVGEDGAVAAVRSHGYLLTVDEAAFMADGDDGDDAEEVEDGGIVDDDTNGNRDDAVSGAAAVVVEGAEQTEDAAVDGEQPGDWNGGDDFDDFDDFDEDDEDDEEEEELDDVLLVAIVEQLVRCCEADDLDPEMAREAERFLGEAKPLLAQLDNGDVDERAFGAAMEKSVRRFQRIYNAVYRPRDAPIVIGGVKMDM